MSEKPQPKKLLLRLPKSLHALLSARAKTEGISMNTLIVMLLSQQKGSK